MVDQDEARNSEGSPAFLELSDGAPASRWHPQDSNGAVDETGVVLALARELAFERRERLDVIRLLVTAIDHLLSELVVAQEEIAQLRARVDGLSRTPVGAEPFAAFDEPGGDSSQEYATLRDHMLRTAREASDVHTRAAELIGRASELVLESERTRASTRRALRARRS